MSPLSEALVVSVASWALVTSESMKECLLSWKNGAGRLTGLAFTIGQEAHVNDQMVRRCPTLWSTRGVCPTTPRHGRGGQRLPSHPQARRMAVMSNSSEDRLVWGYYVDCF